MSDLETLFAQAQLRHRSGDLDAAERDYLRVVERAPGLAEAWHLLGVVAHQRGRSEEAIARFRQALELRPDLAAARNNLALALKAAGRLDDAQAAFATVLERHPDYAEAAYNLALLHEARGDAAHAEAAYRRALRSRPDWPEALGNLGNLLRLERRLDEAAAFLERAMALQPHNADAAGNLALARIDQGRFAEALEAARRALALAPGSALWWETAGSAARLAGDHDGALPFLRRAVELSPDDAALWLELGLAAAECADDQGAGEAMDEALRIAPRWEKLRWARALLLPRIVASTQEAERALGRFDAGLERLRGELGLETAEQRAAALDAAASTVPFNLHYLPGEHVDRQRNFAALVASSVRAALPQFTAAIARDPARADRRIRVGFVSSYLRSHVVARFFAAFITGLDAREFERCVWFTGEAGDEQTRRIAASVERFEAGAPELGVLADSIRGAHLDALVYPDIGLDPRSLALASLRLAPVQAACYGHPVTSGLDSVDYFLSGAALETAESDRQYTERLVRLAALGAMPRAPGAAGDGAWARALRIAGRPLAMCLQNLAKLPPSFDAVLAAILAASGARLVLFDRGAGMTARLRERLARALEEHGVDPAAALHFEPMHEYGEFLGGLAQADVVLDSPGFSGGATSLDALAMGTPIVCFEGATARERQTSAMLRLIDAQESIARDATDYVERAVALLAAREGREALRQRIAERAARLFADPRPLADFSRFLREACRGGGA